MAWTFAGKVGRMDNKLIRHPGHIAVINAMHDMGFFDGKPVSVGGQRISPRAVSEHLLEKHFNRPGEKDLVVIRVIARGTKGGRRQEVTCDMMDFYDAEHGISAMMRTTGFSAAIVAFMLADGTITARGSFPVETGVPTGPFLEHAARRGFNLKWTVRNL